MTIAKKISVCGYVRVSRLLGQSLENQIEPIKMAAEARGFDLIEIYQDEGISGSTGFEQRPGLNKLCRDARSGKFRIVIIAALDRLFRDTRHMLNLVAEWEALGIQLISLRESLDFSTPMGKLMLTLCSSVSSLEKTLIAERIKTALAVRKLAAQKSGSGWRCGPPQKVTAEVRETISALRSSGLSVRLIAKQLGLGKSSVQRVLHLSRDPASTGGNSDDE